MIQQVDDFAVLALSEQIANQFLAHIDEYLIERLKMQGIINYFNGVNLVQSITFITVNCRMYLD